MNSKVKCYNHTIVMDLLDKVKVLANKLSKLSESFNKKYGGSHVE